MSLKFGKDREVSIGYAKIPMFYTNIINPNNSKKELVVMDRMGDNYVICWRNIETAKTGIERLAKATADGFIYKGKEIKFKNCKKVW